MTAWLFLALAIAAEVTATLSLRQLTQGFQPLVLAVVVVGYLVSFALMAVALRSLNVGTVYAVWSSVGTAGVAVAGWLLYRETLNLAALGGLALIVTGVVVLVASGSSGHG